MRRYKTVARILFIVSVVHLALAAPALGRPGHQDVAEDVTAAPEERRSTGGDSGSISSEYFRPSGSSSSLDDDYYHRSQPGSVVSMNFGYDSEELANSPERKPVPVPDSSHDLTTPASGSTSSHLSAGLSTRNGGGGTPNAA